MAKSLRNTTGGTIDVPDTGISINASITYVITPEEYPLWANSADVDPFITNGNLIVNDGYDDLKPQSGLRHMHEESVPRSTAYNAAATVQAAANSTYALTASSRLLTVFTGAVAGQISRLPNATTLNRGHRFEFWMKDGASSLIQYNDGTTFATVGAASKTMVFLVDNTTTNGIWISESTFISVGGDGTDLDSKQFGRQGTISNNTVLLTLNNIPGDTSPDVMAYNYFFRRLAWSNTNNAQDFNIRVWKYSTLLLTSPTIVYDYATGGGRAGYMNFDVNFAIDQGESFYLEVTTVGSPRPADLNVLISLRQR